MLAFSFKTAKPKEKKDTNKSKHKVIKSDLCGVIKLTPEGTYKVIVNNEEYNLTKESLDITNKKICFMFAKKGEILKYCIKEDNFEIKGFPYMAVAPGYTCEGKLVQTIFDTAHFHITKILNIVDSNIRKDFKNNYKTLIKAYNERNCPNYTDS